MNENPSRRNPVRADDFFKRANFAPDGTGVERGKLEIAD
jgi:hypothetical protein